MFRVRAIAVVLFALLVVGAADAWAQGKGRGAPPQAAQGRSQDTLSDSVRRAERDTRGQVLSAERIPFDGREMHRVKVLDERGRVRVYMEDPQQRRGGDHDRPRGPTRDDDD